MPEPSRITRRIGLLVDGALSCPVAEIVAGAGYGKSTVLSVLADRNASHLAAVEATSDPLWSLLDALGRATRQTTPSVAESIAEAYNNVRNNDDAATILGSWWRAQLELGQGPPARIALDDLHLLGDDRVAWLTLEQIISKSWDRVHWILASRSPLKLPTTRWIAAGRMSRGIDASDLGFLPADVLDVADQLGVPLSADDAHLVVEQTAGWPMLIGFMLRIRETHMPKAIALARDRGVGAIFEPLWRSLTQNQRAALVVLALLGSADETALGAAGIAAVGARLRELSAKGVPLIRDASSTYHLHDLVREYLLANEKAHVRTVGSKLSARLLSAGFLEHALTTSMYLNDVKTLKATLDVAGVAAVAESQVSPVLSQVVQFARKNDVLSPTIQAMEAVGAAAVGQVGRAKRLYGEILRETSDALRPSVIMNLAALYINMGEPLPGSIVTVLESEIDKTYGVVNCQMLAIYARHATLIGDRGKATDYLAQALEAYGERSGTLMERVRLLILFAVCLYYLDRREEARSFAEEAAELVESEQISGRNVVALRYLLYAIALANDEPYDDLLGQAEIAATRVADQAALRTTLGAKWMSACEAGDVNEALLVGERCRSIKSGSYSAEAMIQLCDAWMSALNGRYVDAVRTLEKSGEASRYADHIEHRAFLAFLRYKLGDEVAAIDLASNLTKELIAREMGAFSDQNERRGCSEAGVVLLAVFIRLKRVTHAKALLCFIEGLGFTSFSRLARRLHGNQGGPLLGDHDYRLRGLWSLLSSEGKRPCLSPAEIRVLAYLETGKSNKEIAQALGRSPRTVENQLASLARKLNARGRVEILARARSEGLLQQ